MAFRSVKPKRVLMVISVLARGGCERQMLATVSGLISRGYEIEIFTLAPVPNGEPTFEQEFAALGVASSCAFDFGDMTNLTDTTDDEHGLQRFVPILGHLNIARLGQALEQVIRRFQPEVVHCWADLASLVGGLVATSLSVGSTVLQIVSVPPSPTELPGAYLYREAYRLLLRDPNVVMLSNNTANARDFERWLEVSRGTVKLLRNGFLPSSVQIRRGEEIVECRRQFGLPPNVSVVGALMRFADEKDPDLWLETASAIAAARPDVCFVLAGYGVLANRIACKAEEFGLGERLILLGPTRDVGAVYAAMDVFFDDVAL